MPRLHCAALRGLAFLATPMALLALVLLLCVRVHADPGHADDAAPIHFAHPLIAESPSPDTKLRLDGLLVDERLREGESWTARLEAEYAFAPWISLEIDVPYTIRDPDEGSSEAALDDLEVAAKLASFRFADRGLLLGGGLELGLPTGDDSEGIGSNNILEFEPFLDFGWKRNRLELVGFVSAGFLHNEEEDDPEWELGWNLSALVHVQPWLQMLVELDGEEVEGGEEDEFSTARVTPGLKLRPFSQHDLWLGAGVSVPFASDQEFDARTIVSVFWHF